jgi:hypothetical protein
MVVARSDEAARFLQSELLVNFFSNTEEALVNRWRQTLPNDSDQRERIYIQMQLLDNFKLYMEATIDDGRMAATMLDQLLTGQRDQAY